ncbi:MAG: hypothetical protein WA659_05070 [Candidatus Aquirickettsiella sp.]
MPDPYTELSVFRNTLDEVKPFKDKKTAQEFQKNNPTTNSNILIPYYENGRVELLLPGPLSSSPSDLNKNIRVIGARNPTKRKNFSERLKHFFYQKLGIHYVRNINDLIGDSISLDEGRFIITYNQINNNDNDSVFEKFIEKENQESSKQFEENLFAGKPFIDDAEFLENLSKLAADLKLEGGMTYFIFKGKDGSEKILRQTFKQDDNEEVTKFLNNEKELGLAKSAELKPHKYKNYHLLGFVRDLSKWTVYAAVVGILAGLILGFFLTTPLSSILAPLVAVITFVGISSLGFSKATQNNRTTIEFGKSELIDEPRISFVSRMKKSLHSLFSRKSNKTAILSTENTEPEIFTTMMDLPIESNSVSKNLACESLVKSSLSLSLLFKFRQENDSSITEEHHLHSTHTILKK